MKNKSENKLTEKERNKLIKLLNAGGYGYKKKVAEQIGIHQTALSNIQKTGYAKAEFIEKIRGLLTRNLN
jgi:hypothetical protein